MCIFNTEIFAVYVIHTIFQRTVLESTKPCIPFLSGSHYKVWPNLPVNNSGFYSILYNFCMFSRKLNDTKCVSISHNISNDSSRIHKSFHSISFSSHYIRAKYACAWTGRGTFHNHSSSILWFITYEGKFLNFLMNNSGISLFLNEFSRISAYFHQIKWYQLCEAINADCCRFC